MLHYILYLYLCATVSAGAGKRGLMVPWDSVASDLDQLPIGDQISWYGNWECYLPPGRQRLDYVAMLRTAHPDDIQRFQTNMPNNGAKVLMCLNEPNEVSQANLSPDEAARIWRQYCWPQKARGVKLVSPTISNGQNGIPWLQSFIDKTRDVPPDIIGVHWYGVDGNNMIWFVQEVFNRFQKPIYVSEFAHTTNNIYDQRGLQEQVRKWMDNQWFVYRYAWFGCSRGDKNNINQASRLLDFNGKPTDLYYQYAYNK